MITVNLKPWTQLTRNGIPAFRVVRRPLTLAGRVFEPGHEVPHSCFVNRVRIRQMYEQRRIEPVIAPAGTVQASKDKKQANQVKDSVKSVKPVVQAKPGLVAKASVPALTDTDPLLSGSGSVAIPLAESDTKTEKPAGRSGRPMRGYTPTRKR